MSMDIAIKGTTDIEVIKYRIYEVRGMGLRSQIVMTNGREKPSAPRKRIGYIQQKEK